MTLPRASCLFPSEDEIARLILGDRAKEWPAVAALNARKGGFPPIDRTHGGRYWPAVLRWYNRSNGVDAESSQAAAPTPTVNIVPFAPDGVEDFNGEKAAAASRQRRDRRVGRARP